MDRVDRLVVGDRLERDVGNGAINKAFFDVVFGGLRGDRLAGQISQFCQAFRGIFQQVIGIFSGHQSCASQCQRHATGIDRDPTSPPLFSHIGGRSRSASWI